MKYVFDVVDHEWEADADAARQGNATAATTFAAATTTSTAAATATTATTTTSAAVPSVKESSTESGPFSSGIYMPHMVAIISNIIFVFLLFQNKMKLGIQITFDNTYRQRALTYGKGL